MAATTLIVALSSVGCPVIEGGADRHPPCSENAFAASNKKTNQINAGQFPSAISAGEPAIGPQTKRAKRVALYLRVSTLEQTTGRVAAVFSFHRGGML